MCMDFIYLFLGSRESSRLSGCVPESLAGGLEISLPRSQFPLSRGSADTLQN